MSWIDFDGTKFYLTYAILDSFVGTLILSIYQSEILGSKI